MKLLLLICIFVWLALRFFVNNQLCIDRLVRYKSSGNDVFSEWVNEWVCKRNVSLDRVWNKCIISDSLYTIQYMICRATVYWLQWNCFRRYDRLCMWIRHLFNYIILKYILKFLYFWREGNYNSQCEGGCIWNQWLNNIKWK